MKKYTFPVLLGILLLAFVLIPLPKRDVTIRFTTIEEYGKDFKLYYSTASSQGFSEENCLVPEKEDEEGQLTFIIPGEVISQLEALRMDFPQVASGTYCFSDVSISSAGIVRKRIHPCAFFSEENLSQQNDITTINYCTAITQAQILTDGTDPFVFFDGQLTLKIMKCASRLRLTRLGIALVILIGIWSYKKDIFHTKEGTQNNETIEG